MTLMRRLCLGLGLAVLAGPALASGGGMPQLNVHDFAPQLVWLAILFTAFYGVVRFVAVPGIEQVLTNRQDKLDGDFKAAERSKAEADLALKAYETALASARARAQATVASKTADLAATAEAHKKSVEADLNAKLAAAADEIRAKRAEAMANVRGLAGEVTQAAVAHLIGTAPSGAQADQAVARALGEVA